ncbi:trypsin-7-like [Venturia canescens]|uniref:trypsin-7-like n=1 Tax=Venturia canescens TaxID=32260 RepID=UPI001C9D143A|nr:trypsin-7-like [Venturia canescens]
MSRRFALVLVCHLVIYHRLPCSAETRGIEIARISRGTLNFGMQKIIGGEPTIIEKYPYVVSLQENGTFFGHDFEHFCGGNIINEKWILTAAKCCYGKKPSQFHVRLGSKLYYTGGRIHEIESIEIHPNYDEITWDYDVGLLKLRETIIFSEKVQPIRLPKADCVLQAGSILEIVGWGSTKLLGLPSNVLYRNSMLTINRSECESVYSPDALTDRMFCVLREGHGPCIGDTGSPAVIDGVLIGVASWSQSCAYKYPTAYARLPEMVDWIIKVTGNSSPRANNANNNDPTLPRASH